ncbi:hypothetical protein AT959_02545 [Dechloromonas denitrificans]|uniref:Uncharacterized protein n=1 Tax=Dechloromonas denitrificans TaxID=281362 RepID=A0A133XNR3_9RHOO|nr:hypothetical protein [Dechloromonas denitrificans]KXB32578.1 hypothetical protein AT959_02545 [Dechloromonas denitrificans]
MAQFKLGTSVVSYRIAERLHEEADQRLAALTDKHKAEIAALNDTIVLNLGERRHSGVRHLFRAYASRLGVGGKVFSKQFVGRGPNCGGNESDGRIDPESGHHFEILRGRTADAFDLAKRHGFLRF